MSSHVRGKRIDRGDIIERLISSHHLTQDGADWLRLRMDPYHDLQKPIAGYPDSDALDTIVSCQNYEYVVTKPAGLAAGDWDAHVFTLPFDSTALSLGTLGATGNFVQAATSFNLGLVNVAKDAAGGPLFPTANPIVSGDFSMTRINTFEGVEAGLSRVIGCGLEIIDTTAVLNQQGSITCYKMPSYKETYTKVGWLNTAGTMQSNGDFAVVMQPPSGVAEAVLYRTTVQWDVKKGVYMTLGQEGVNNPFEIAHRNGVLITPDVTMSAASPALCSSLSATTALQAPPSLTSTMYYAEMKHINVTQSGVFLTGLANTASFKVRVRVYVERAPLMDEIDLVPLATPSAAYDAKALELYSQLVSCLPVAVPVDFNAKGDWWRWILKAVGALAPGIGMALTPVFGPGAAAIGNSLGGIARGINQNLIKMDTAPIINNKQKQKFREKVVPQLKMK